MNRLKVLALFFLALAGCASNSSVKTDTPTLKLDYHTQVNAPQNGKIIAITSYQFLTNGAAQAERADTIVFGIKLASRSLPFSAVTTYHDKYEAPLHKAMQASLAELMSKRGFTTTGPFKSIDTIPYTDKKSIYLIMLPKLNLNIEQHSISNECVHSICTETGVISLRGELLIRFIEPLSEQTLLAKHTDFNGLHIKKTYVHQYPQETHKAVRHGLESTATPYTPLIDDADKKLVDAINEFYQDAMADTDKLLSAEELLSHQADLDKMRGFKRN